jgi:hypothetical protein
MTNGLYQSMANGFVSGHDFKSCRNAMKKIRASSGAARFRPTQMFRGSLGEVEN